MPQPLEATTNRPRPNLTNTSVRCVQARPGGICFPGWLPSNLAMTDPTDGAMFAIELEPEGAVVGQVGYWTHEE